MNFALNLDIHIFLSFSVLIGKRNKTAHHMNQKEKDGTGEKTCKHNDAEKPE